MPITTNSYFSVRYNDNEVDKIGLSDTLDNYTADDIQSYIFCGCRDKLLGGNLAIYNAGEGSYDVWNEGTPFATGAVDYTYMHMYNGDGNNDNADLEGRYCGTVLLTDTLSAFPMSIKSEDLPHFKLITELDIKHYCMDISATLTQKGGIGATQLSDKSNTLYCVDIDLASLYYRYGTPPVNVPVSLAVVPYHVFSLAGELFLVNGYKTNKLGFSCRLAPNRNAGLEIYPISSSSDESSYSIAFNCSGFGNDYTSQADNTYAWAYGNDTVNKFGTTDAGLWYQCYFGILLFDVRYYYTSYDQMMLQFANTGLLFRIDGVIYKPLIADNVVYGYTDNLDAESDIDNWERTTKHDIPLTPPVPPPIDKHDNEVDMNLTHLSSLNGFVKYYVMGISTADDLADALNRFDITLIGKDLLPNLISYKMFAIPTAAFDTGTERVITIAGHEMKRGDDSDIKAPLVIDINPITLDSIKLENVYNDFRDYEPYTKIEMYVPFCGWFSLPSWCMGRTISGEMFVDLPNGSVKAVIKASKTVVAEVGGSCAVDVPFVAQSVGSKAAAIISNMTAGAVAMATQNPQSIVSSSLGIATAFNANYTQIKGVMGDGSNIQGLDRVYIKVTRPAPTENANGVISDKYKHERGIPCGKTLKLTAGDGFTQIMDANIDGTMTDREKQMIIDGFRHGLIL